MLVKEPGLSGKERGQRKEQMLWGFLGQELEGLFPAVLLRLPPSFLSFFSPPHLVLDFSFRPFLHRGPQQPTDC